jgi:hypothetical protein
MVFALQSRAAFGGQPMGVPVFKTQICMPVRKFWGQLTAIEESIILGFACSKACFTSPGCIVKDLPGLRNWPGIVMASKVESTTGPA